MLFYCYGGKMNNKSIMYQFIKKINDVGLITKFIINIFDYRCINDNNYIFRISENNEEIIIDIYDNISNTRFNRYIFNFIDNSNVKKYKDDFVYITYISILNVVDSDNKLLKLSYLFKIDCNKMLEYADNFFDKDFVEILKDTIK